MVQYFQNFLGRETRIFRSHKANHDLMLPLVPTYANYIFLLVEIIIDIDRLENLFIFEVNNKTKDSVGVKSIQTEYF